MSHSSAPEASWTGLYLEKGLFYFFCILRTSQQTNKQIAPRHTHHCNGKGFLDISGWMIVIYINKYRSGTDNEVYVIQFCKKINERPLYYQESFIGVILIKMNPLSGHMTGCYSSLLHCPTWLKKWSACEVRWIRAGKSKISHRQLTLERE